MILQRLREETRPDHERLEAHIDLLNRPWTTEFYRALLEKFYGIYAVIETPTFSFPQWTQGGFDLTSRTKLPSLRRDLHFLGLGDAEIESLPLCDSVPPIASFPAALGAAYVMEGSTLGGQIISRHLAKELALSSREGLNFFGSYGESVGPMWKEFTGFLNSCEFDEREEMELLSTSVATFRAFDDWLTDIL